MTTLTRPTQGYTDHFNVEDSSVIESVFYDAFERKLFVYLASGSVAAYKDVERYDYEDFITAPSMGRYWNQVVKKRFRGINSDVELFKRPTPTVVVDAANLNVAEDNEPVQFSYIADTQAETVAADRVWLVTVAVQAPNLGVAVNEAVSAGFEVVAVNTQ